MSSPVVHIQGSDLTLARNMFAILPTWISPTDASRTVRVTLNPIDFGGTREVIRMEANGTVGKLSFFGATALTQQNGAVAGLDSIIAGFGLCSSITAALFDRDVTVQVAGKGLQVKEGSNAKQGVATLVGGTVVVANTSVTANSRIFLTVQSLGTVAVPSGYCVSARTPGTSFTILASAVTDTSVVAWEIFEPA